MTKTLKNMGFEIFVETPEHLTIRAQFPKDSSGRFERPPFNIYSMAPGGLTADFVLARKEGDYSDGRRPDSVEVGSLEDDLARRDFRMNAIAKDPEGNLIDPHNGVQDINERVIRAVGNAQDRLREDALRAVRALRFSVTLGFRIDHELMFAMENAFVLDAIRDNISDERIREELNKMLAVDTLGTLSALGRYKDLTTAMFSGRVSLEATMKKRKRR
jgi:tRNA nucleotidyltransferase/poly(A) polymerase